MEFVIKIILIKIYVVSTCASVILAQFLFVSNYASTSNDYAMSCAPTIKCDVNSKYRSMNGSCNNLRFPWLGASKTPHLRIVDAHYDDGKYEFRKQTDGTPLPNARTIQLEVFLYKQFPNWNDHNVLFMEWGQFIAHDITNLPPDNSAGENCCEVQNANPVPFQCQAVIEVPKNDPVYIKRGQTCINFVRALTSANASCPLTPTTFMVHATHYMDGSMIYGTHDDEAKSLRSFINGRLKSDFTDGLQEFCPQKNRSSSQCGSSKHSSFCFLAGDPRVNQNLGIALYQNIFLRFHNVVARDLYRLHPFWNDETLYQETRRIVIAVIQHITYTYYLPILLGEKFTFLNGFHEPTVYEELVHPSTSQEFSTGAFRIIHKEIPAIINFIDENHLNLRQVLLTDWMDKPDILSLSNSFDLLLRGFQETPTRSEQSSYNPLISNFLNLQTTPKFRGADLLSADIQRGRDTGMPPYNKMRPVCGIPEANSFDDLIDLIPNEDVQKLKKLYSSVDDIDFIVGALLEIPAEGARVGPTSRCIIADSFYRYKTGDRFFYDIQGQPSSFSAEQLEAIKKLNFGHVICATSNLRHLPKNVFMPLNNKLNAKQYSCDSFRLNWNPWKQYYNYY